jgi:hypothetical protein
MAQAPTETLDPVERLERMQAMAQDKPNQNLVTREQLDVSTASVIWGTTVTAKKVEVERDEAKILRRIATRAAAAGDDWYYRFPVKEKRGGIKYIEGPSVKCAYAVASLFGNCEIDARVIDGGATWLIYARFADHETGFSLIRPFQGDKFASRLGGEDEARRRDAAFGIAVSKAERNVITNALDAFCWYGFEEAKKNLVERVGKHIETYRLRILERLGELEIDVKRVEKQMGRVAADWLASDIAQIIAEIQAVKDGMATADETWPAPDEPRRTDNVTDVEHVETGPATTPPRQGGAGPAAADPNAPPASSPPPLWLLPENLMGQDAIIIALNQMIARAATLADVSAIETVNAERIAKITGIRRQTLNVTLRDRRAVIEAGIKS